MRLLRFVIGLSLLFSFSIGVSAGTASQWKTIHLSRPTAPLFADRQLLVAFKPGTNDKTIAELHRLAGGRVVRRIEALGLQLVEVPARSVAQTGAIYRRSPVTRYAEPNYNRVLSPLKPMRVPEEGSGSLLGAYFNQQWGLHNEGQAFYYFNLMSGTDDADIDAPQGWDIVESMGIALGYPEVKVAILDTGVDCGHVDLRAENGDIKCADSVNYTASSSAGDLFGHGTHVAGIVAANTDNGLGVAGVAESAVLGSFKVCDDSGVCPDDAIIRGIIDAADADYAVINMSFGGPESSQALLDAVEYAWAHGVVLVSSAGNESTESIGFPAGLDKVIAVAANDANDDRASFSNYGSQVSVTAPGDPVLSTMPMAFCPGDPTGCYEFLSGTSQASPHVAGIAALIWARSDVTTNEQVRYVIENSADKTGAAGQNLPAWTQNGRVNLAAAMTYPAQAGNAAPIASFYYACVALTCDFNASGSSDVDGEIRAYAWDFGDADSAAGVTTSHTYDAGGSYTVVLTVTDDRNAEGSTTKVVSVSAPGSAPTAVFSYRCTGQSCTFDGSASNDSDPGDAITQYDWNFGGAGTQYGSGAVVKYDYSAGGTYTVSLTVTDTTALTGMATASVRVKDNGKSAGDSGTGDGGSGGAVPFCDRKPDHPKCR